MLFQSSLLKKAQRGNEKAFLLLIEDEKVKLYKMAYVYMKNENDALDIVQETVMKAFMNLHTVKEAHYFSTWILRILINTAIEVLRKNSKVIVLNEVLPERSLTVEHEDRIDLLDAIHQLEEKYQTVILLKYYRDLTVREIAELINCPEGTVKTNIHRGLSELKKRFIQGGAVDGKGY